MCTFYAEDREQLYDKLAKKYLLTEEQLEENGFPRPTARRGVVTVRHIGRPIADIKVLSPDESKHECCRCKKPFIIYRDGTQTEEECVYHFKRAYTPRGNMILTTFDCCNPCIIGLLQVD